MSAEGAEYYPWRPPGRDLQELYDRPAKPKRLVACLNVWDDLYELECTLPKWYDHVDHVFAIDGAYAGTPVDKPGSTDGTVEYLKRLDKVEFVRAKIFYADQSEKRTRYFQLAQPGDVLFVIDADEYVYDPAMLRALPLGMSVGWVTVESPIYKRPQQQPRLFAYRPELRYGDRHHWIYSGDRLVCTHQQGGGGFEHRLIGLTIWNSRGRNRTPERSERASRARIMQLSREQRVGDARVVGHEPLRICQVGPFDAGHVVQRLHTGINTTSPHESIMFTGGDHPFKEPVQLCPDQHPAWLGDAMYEADIVHYHVNYFGRGLHPKVADRKLAVMHHHGTELRTHADQYAEEDAKRVGLRLVSNLELLQYGDGLHWLPNPVPVARYRRLRQENLARIQGEPDNPLEGAFRVAHSPSKPELKGTEVFLKACENLQRKGLAVTPVLITRTSLAESLRIKSTCDAVFDSMWLGMQCSGIEGAAMGLPVIAGDPDCATEYEKGYGAVPYTYANDLGALTEALERLVTEDGFYQNERSRVSAFVSEWHDTANVVARYLDLLDEAFQWRERLTLGNPIPLKR